MTSSFSFVYLFSFSELDHVTLLVNSLKIGMPYYECLLPLLGYRKLRRTGP